ncbi:hypothetical protein RJT34_22623 [Clitoria ternatea]|uniref:JmjC domain-containing protein n=1 Tax=Clitoria ternatea TaxID=43366 RepID=A0AAN9FT84_CLITE
MNSTIGIRAYEELPTPKDFDSLIEPTNVPAVFRGCTIGWRAFSHWNPSNGGLDYLQARIGSCMVEAMVSESAPVFYGDLGNHQRVPLPFSSFLSFCKKRMQTERKHQKHAGSSLEDEQFYLAQVPIMNSDRDEQVQLETLREDIQMPPILASKELSSINFWMNNAHARSSTHYDPHHNLLCVVSGRKLVVLWPPAASPTLYPMPIYGEASNHSSVTLENPDYSRYPRAERSMEFAQKAVLEAGDALFIPEGWFHQVDSDDLTIAINFWWRSNVMSCMSEHMDAYYLRRILRRLIDKEMDQLLLKLEMGKTRICASKLPNDGQADFAYGNYGKMLRGMSFKFKEKNTLLDIEPAAVQVLHEVVSLVHNSVSANHDHVGNDKCEKVVTAGMKDDLVAKILWNVEAKTLQHAFLAMARYFPRSLEALVLHVLTPIGAEVLTRKFDEMDQLTIDEDRNKFYEAFYSAFDDQSTAMNSILKGKESFTRQAYKNVLDKFVGVNLEGSKPRIR